MEWASITLEGMARFFTKHSLIFKDKERNLNQDAMIKSAELYAIIREMREREVYDFIDEGSISGLLKRVHWVFRQLLINYRTNYKEFSQFEDDTNRFFKVDPTGKVTVDQRIYNIPKHLKDIGAYPSLASGTWIKEIEYAKREWDR